MKHWLIEDVAWDRFEAARVDPAIVALVKAAAMVERNGADYARYLNGVFADDPDFCAAADRWAVEEVQHGEALGRWAMLAEPSWDFAAAFARYREGFRIDVGATRSLRGSRAGELVARCMVETGTSSYYTALGEATQEPVLRQVCQLIAADEFRHFKLFYDHMRRYLGRERISLARRLAIALGRIGESEDDELAYAFHCGNEPTELAYDHERCLSHYMSGAIGFYRFRHIERATGMILKAVGLKPRGALSDVAARLAWRLLHARQRRLARRAPMAARSGTA